MNSNNNTYCQLPTTSIYPKKKAMKSRNIFLTLIIASLLIISSSCSRLGYGVLLWSTEDPYIPSGTVLSVYIKSNIEQLWVVGVPGSSEKIEIPLPQLEFVGSKGKAEKMALDFAEFASIYAESLQDGLPIRERPDNVSKRVYRMRLNEIIKVLEIAEGNPPIGTTGEPLEGDWLLVLTTEGVRGYCFSYRLKLFDETDGTVISSPTTTRDGEQDPELVSLLAKTWVPVSYQTMINAKQVNIDEFEKRYRFDPGYNSGIARIYHPDADRSFRYDRIVSDGVRFWNFEGTTLQMQLRSNTSLAVHYQENRNTRTLLFTTLTEDIDDIIEQEYERRQEQFMTLFDNGPIYTSSNYGTIEFTEDGFFSWTDYELLVPQFIPFESTGVGTVLMNYFITSSFADRYSGAINFLLTDISPARSLVFLYNLDDQGLKLEAVPVLGIEDSIIVRRDASPFTLYFYRDTHTPPPPEE